jgi:holliday junction DNA helicase RuvA
MISCLRGKVIHLEDHAIVLDVMGIGFHLQCSSKSIGMLEEGQEVTLFTELQMREHDVTLFGFHNERERFWFKTLLNVQGVGGRVALAILSSMTIDELLQALMMQDKVMIQRAEGVGPKLASRILVELKDKVGNDITLPSAKIVALKPLTENSSLIMMQEAVSVLVNLGYQRDQALSMIQKAHEDGEIKHLDQLIKKALKEGTAR